MARSPEIDQGDRRYIAAVMAAPVLKKEYEFALAHRWRDHKDEDALHELITAYARFVVRIAWGFRGYGLPIGDLVQEGNVGLMVAATRFDPEHNARFSTYAGWWIMAAIQDHVLRHNSIVRVATTPTQRRLFFNLRKARARLATGPDGELTAADRELMAEQLKVTPADIERMETHLDGPDASLNATVGVDDDSTQQMDLLKDNGPGPEDVAIDVIDGETRSRWLREAMDVLTPRERQIIVSRFLEEDKSTLAKIGADFGLSKARIRQIEAKALTKLRHAIRDRGVEPGGALPN